MDKQGSKFLWFAIVAFTFTRISNASVDPIVFKLRDTQFGYALKLRVNGIEGKYLLTSLGHGLLINRNENLKARSKVSVQIGRQERSLDAVYKDLGDTGVSGLNGAVGIDIFKNYIVVLNQKEHKLMLFPEPSIIQSVTADVFGKDTRLQKAPCEILKNGFLQSEVDLDALKIPIFILLTGSNGLINRTLGDGVPIAYAFHESPTQNENISGLLRHSKIGEWELPPIPLKNDSGHLIERGSEKIHLAINPFGVDGKLVVFDFKSKLMYKERTYLKYPLKVVLANLLDLPLVYDGDHFQIKEIEGNDRTNTFLKYEGATLEQLNNWNVSQIVDALRGGPDEMVFLKSVANMLRSGFLLKFRYNNKDLVITQPAEN